MIVLSNLGILVIGVYFVKLLFRVFIVVFLIVCGVLKLGLFVEKFKIFFFCDFNFLVSVLIVIVVDFERDWILEEYNMFNFC